jgi:hypothetical protein
MEMKRFVVALLLGWTFFGMMGCAMSDEGLTTNPNNEQNGELELLNDGGTPNRKIIYVVNVEYDVENLSDAAAFLISIMESDEWMDKEVRGVKFYVFDARIKTERLDQFLSMLNESFEMMTYQKQGTDISLQYQDMSNRILALQTQLDRLLALYQTASLSDMIVINREISQIEIELVRLQGNLNRFDSLVEYSEVHIRFYGDTIITRSPFFNRLWTTFVSGWEGVVAFIDGFFIVLAAVFPFAIVFGIPGTWLFIRIRNRKRKRLEE